MSRRSWFFDIAVAVVAGVLGQLWAWTDFGGTNHQGPAWAESVLYSLAAALLVFRRIHPVAVLAVMVAVYVTEFAVFGSPEGYGVMVAPMIAVYTVGRYLDPRAAVPGLGLIVVLWAGWMTFDPLNNSWAERVSTAVWLTPWLAAWLLGALLRATSMNREQRRIASEQRESRAVAEERNRIARELHDVIGHSLAVMTVQASVARRRLSPGQAVERQALETVEAVGRQALAEMRRMVGVLRDTGGDEGPGRDERTSRAPPPSLSQVDRLADRFRAAGLPVSVSVTGDCRELSPGIDLTAYRIVQEGLTNTLRHASNARAAEVEIAYGDRSLELAVRDDGTAAVSTRTPGTGVGLLGMRERVAVYGGSIDARARPEGGFELLARLPLEPA